MLAQLSEAFFLGLSTGPACLGYCAPVCVPLLGCEQRPWRETGRVLGLFLLGRFVGYSAIGAAAGAVGILLQGLNPVFWGVVRILMGISLVLFALYVDGAGIKRLPRPAAKETSLWFAASLGLLTGLNLCPPFGAAIAGAAATASMQSALFYFWAFFAGTSVYFGPLLFISPLSRSEAVRQIARVCLFLAGAWLMAEGLIALLIRR